MKKIISTPSNSHAIFKHILHQFSTATPKKTCFINHASDVPVQWVERLAKDLRRCSIHVIWHKWHRQDSVSKFSERVATADFALVIGSPGLIADYMDHQHPSALRHQLFMVNLRQMNPQFSGKQLPILFDGELKTSIQASLQFVPELDFRHTLHGRNASYVASFFSLIEIIHDIDQRSTHRSDFINRTGIPISPVVSSKHVASTLFPETCIWDPNLDNSLDQFFVGRQPVITHIHNYFSNASQNRQRMVVLTGISGVGKSMLAREIARNKRDQGQSLTWLLQASTPAELTKSFRDLAAQLGISQHLPLDDVKTQVKMRLSQKHRNGFSIFIVIDDAPNFPSVEPYLPSEGDILITSLNQQWPIETIPVPNFQIEDVRAYFKKLNVGPWEPQNATDTCSPEQRQALETFNENLVNLAEELHYLPLALSQAGSYIKHVMRSHAIDAYMAQLKRQKAPLLQKHSLYSKHKPVLDTWMLIMDELSNRNKHAVEFMYACTFLSPHHIPNEFAVLFLKDKQKPMRTDTISADQTRESFEALTTALETFSLIGRTQHDFSVHALLMDIIKLQFEPKLEPTTVLSFNQESHRLFKKTQRLAKYLAWMQSIQDEARASRSEHLILHAWKLVREAKTISIDSDALVKENRQLEKSQQTSMLISLLTMFLSNSILHYTTPHKEVGTTHTDIIHFNKLLSTLMVLTFPNVYFKFSIPRDWLLSLITAWALCGTATNLLQKASIKGYIQTKAYMYAVVCLCNILSTYVFVNKLSIIKQNIRLPQDLRDQKQLIRQTVERFIKHVDLPLLKTYDAKTQNSFADLLHSFFQEGLARKSSDIKQKLNELEQRLGQAMQQRGEEMPAKTQLSLMKKEHKQRKEEPSAVWNFLTACSILYILYHEFAYFCRR